MLAFDTHKFVKDLTKAGMAVEQAEVLAATYATILTEQVATKADIRLLQKDITSVRTEISGLKSGMAEMDTSLRAEIAAMDTSLRAEIAGLEESLRKDMAAMEESIRKDMAGLEERMDLKLQAVEQRLERKIVNTGVINVLATCTIIGLVITLLT